MEFLKVLAAWTAIIVVLSIPLIFVAALWTLGTSGLIRFLEQARHGRWDRAAWGLAALALATGAGWLAWRLVNPPAPSPPQVTVAEPRAHWAGRLPDLIIVDHAAYAPAAFVMGGRRVLVTEALYGNAQWRSVEAKQSPFCKKVLSSVDYVVDEVSCLEMKPAAHFLPVDLGPHFAIERSGGFKAGGPVAASVYLVHDQQRQLVASCRGELDPYRPQLAWLGLGGGNARARALNICLRRAMLGLPDMIDPR